MVASNMPRTFEELRRMFVESAPHASAELASSEGSPAGPRRSRIERRSQEDRRLFPPRPEGRRMAGGRRGADSQ
jgi:hypothetical protein